MPIFGRFNERAQRVIAAAQKAAGTALNEKDVDAYRCELVRKALKE